MSKILSIIVGLIIISVSSQAFANVPYGHYLCKNPNFFCYKAKSGDSWSKLFPDKHTRDLVQRVNRRSNRIYPGMFLAIPKNLKSLRIVDVSPFAAKMRAPGEKLIIVDLKKLAWGAYNEDGHLLHWGPANGGKDYCKDVGQACRTKTGIFRIFEKQPAQCISNTFPIEWAGGAAMPYCMQFYRGFALHGSLDVPGYNASHGCVRFFIKDARWLNEYFVDLGTKVIVQPY